MTVDNDPTARYIKEIVLPVVETAYSSTVKVVDHIDSLRDAGTLSLTSYEYFVRDYARLLVAIETLINDNVDLRAELAAHVMLTKLTNLLTLNRNVKALQEVDPAMIAAGIKSVRTPDIMTAAIEEIKTTGNPEDIERLRWIKEAVKDVV